MGVKSRNSFILKGRSQAQFLYMQSLFTSVTTFMCL